MGETKSQATLANQKKKIQYKKMEPGGRMSQKELI